MSAESVEDALRRLKRQSEEEEDELKRVEEYAKAAEEAARKAREMAQKTNDVVERNLELISQRRRELAQLQGKSKSRSGAAFHELMKPLELEVVDSEGSRLEATTVASFSTASRLQIPKVILQPPKVILPAPQPVPQLVAQLAPQPINAVPEMQAGDENDDNLVVEEQVGPPPKKRRRRVSLSTHSNIVVAKPRDPPVQEVKDDGTESDSEDDAVMEDETPVSVAIQPTTPARKPRTVTPPEKADKKNSTPVPRYHVLVQRRSPPLLAPHVTTPAEKPRIDTSSEDARETDPASVPQGLPAVQSQSTPKVTFQAATPPGPLKPDTPRVDSIAPSSSALFIPEEYIPPAPSPSPRATLTRQSSPSEDGSEASSLFGEREAGISQSPPAPQKAAKRPTPKRAANGTAKRRNSEDVSMARQKKLAASAQLTSMVQEAILSKNG